MKDDSLEKDFLAAYDAHADAIFRHCYFKTSDRELAKDMAQDVFLKFWSYQESREPILNARALLYRLADNLVIDWYRKRKSQSLDALMEDGFEPADIHHRTDEQAEISHALEKLKLLEESDRRVITLRLIEELSPAEIAEITGETQNMVSVHLHRALKKLQALLQ